MKDGKNYNWTALSYDVDKDRVAIMYRKVGKSTNGKQNNTLEECGWISQAEIWLDNEKIKEFVSNINPKVALRLNHSPEKYASWINRSIDYEVYRMTGVKFMDDGGENERRIINIPALRHSKEDVIKSVLKAIDDVLTTDYTGLYEKSKEKAAREKNTSALAETIERAAWEDNERYDKAKAIIDEITGKDEEGR